MKHLSRFRALLPMLAAIAASVVLCAAYAYLPLSGPARSASPDERANLFFSERFSERGELWYFQPLNLAAPGMVHPRSVRVVDDFLVPGGFIGLPVLYGGVAALTGKATLPYMTPGIAVLAVWVWYMLIAQYFGKRLGVAAATLLAFHPVWWYETARTMQPNVAFAALVIFAAWFFFATPFARAHASGKGHRVFVHLDGILAGVFAALALAVRASEAYWFAFAALAIALALRFRLPWKRIIVTVAAAVVTLVPFLIMNTSLYGSPFATGYGAAVSAPVTELPQGKGAALLGPLQPYLFPLGFAPRSALAHFVDFGIGITWWWSVLVGCALIGAAVEAWRLRRRGASIPQEVRAFAAASMVIAVWLILFYGSWTIRDNPDPDAVTIGSSYLRYWLPLYVLSTVPVAWLAVRATGYIRGRAQYAALAGFLALSALAGVTDAFWSPQEGLVHVRAALVDSDAKAREILDITPANALIVTDRADKYLFPERQVMVPLRSEATYAALGKLVGRAQLYYFGITFPEGDMAWLNGVKLPPLGLSIAPVRTIGKETLYQFVPLTQPSE